MTAPAQPQIPKPPVPKPAAPKPPAPAQPQAQPVQQPQIQIPSGQTPIAPATTPQGTPPAQQITPPQPTAPYAAQAQERAAQAQGNLGTAPDRAQLAQQSLAQMQQDMEPGFQQSMRAVGQNAAKFGRIGAGMTTNELTDVGLARQRTLDSEAAKLGLAAADKTMDDRLNTARSALEQFSAFQGADQTGQKIALDTELGRGNLAVDNRRLDQQAADSQTDARLRESDLALRSQLGLGGLDLDKQKLGEDRRQFDASDDFRRVEADRDFILDDRVAEALASLEGYDLMGTGVDPAMAANPQAAAAAMTPEEQQALLAKLGVNDGIA